MTERREGQRWGLFQRERDGGGKGNETEKGKRGKDDGMFAGERHVGGRMGRKKGK